MPASWQRWGMSLVLPGEIVVERVLPTVRAMLARRLSERGLTQQAIADHLGVTQAAVSNYVAGDATLEPAIADDPRTADAVDRIAAGLADGEYDGYDALADLMELIREFEERGPICELHEAEMPELQGLGCDLCVRGVDEAVRAERDVLADVRKAAQVLATTTHAADYVPNVGTNVGMALPDPTDHTDVAAIPGRVYAVGGRVEVPANPEFGASRHVATTIIAANAVDPSIRGAVNLATDDRLLAAVRARGGDPLEFDPDYDDRGSHLRERFRERGEVPPVVYHRGAFGIEPVTYVLGESAVDAADLAADLVAAAERGDGTGGGGGADGEGADGDDRRRDWDA
jgi:predicted fused transcriptional regulator/phosphomethylpyrimidine kinase/predicted transcriptional regulator